MVVDARVAEYLSGDAVLRIEAPLLRIKPEPGDMQTLEPLGAHGVRLALDVDEAVGPVDELLVDVLRNEPQDARDNRRDLRRVLDLQRVGVDGDRLLADRELDARAVVDRSAVGREIDRRAVLARRHPPVRLRPDALQPDCAQERGAEDDRENGEKKADPAVREPAAQRAWRGAMST